MNLTTLVHLAQLANITTHLATTASSATANPLLWYVTRAAAVSSYIALTILVLLGITRSLLRIGGSRASWMLDEAHQFLAILVAALVSLHLLSLIFDPLIPFALINILVPLNEPYRPFAADLGVLTLYGLLIVLFSSWLRRYISHASWRTLHYIGFVIFLLVTLHGILAGSDSSEAWMIFVYVVASGSVLLMSIFRALYIPPPQTQRAAQQTRYAPRRPR